MNWSATAFARMRGSRRADAAFRKLLRRRQSRPCALGKPREFLGGRTSEKYFEAAFGDRIPKELDELCDRARALLRPIVEYVEAGQLPQRG
jgi:hypothetical protein